jgi:hypothetical protein
MIKIGMSIQLLKRRNVNTTFSPLIVTDSMKVKIVGTATLVRPVD